MISSLRGTVIQIGLGSAVIECGGVGYEILAAPQTLATLTRGEEAFVLTTFVVKEDSQTLFGFSDDSNRKMFSLLQTVQGVGPKIALAAQSVFNSQEIAQAISSGDAKGLQKIPGVGKRAAERMIVDLKDKVQEFALPGDAAATTHVGVVTNVDLVHDVVEALVGLGFAEKIAEPLVTSIVAKNDQAQTSEVLRLALSSLGKKK